MNLLVIVLIIILLFAFVGGVPSMGYHQYGWGPSGIVGVILVVILLLFLFGRL